MWIVNWSIFSAVCSDNYAKCKDWANWGHCTLNPTVMWQCVQSCAPRCQGRLIFYFYHLFFFSIKPLQNRMIFSEWIYLSVNIWLLMQISASSFTQFIPWLLSFSFKASLLHHLLPSNQPHKHLNHQQKFPSQTHYHQLQEVHCQQRKLVESS